MLNNLKDQQWKLKTFDHSQSLYQTHTTDKQRKPQPDHTTASCLNNRQYNYGPSGVWASERTQCVVKRDTDMDVMQRTLHSVKRQRQRK